MKLKRKPEFENNKGVDALERLINIAFNYSHQCKYVRDFLLHLYNHNNPIDLIAIFQVVDADITQDCLAVMVMRARERWEPHSYFENGGQIFRYLYSLNVPPLKAVYDNGGQTVDRYTVILSEGDAIPPRVPCLGLSDNPDSPQGFSQYGECLEGEHLGKKISFEDLPENVQEYVKRRLEE